MDSQVTDEAITKLLKEGKKDKIIREVLNLMPLPCVTCTKDSEYQAGDRPAVRCRRCSRGACKDCFPQPKNGWVFLCSICDKNVMRQFAATEAFFSKKKKAMGVKNTQEVASQNVFETLTEEGEDNGEDDEEDNEDEEDKELEEAAKRREEKRKNKEGGKKKREEAELCKSFKFGGKCPHGMSGQKKHNQWENCKFSHPKVCNKLLSHGHRAKQGCDGKGCNKYHPKMCYSSVNTLLCTKEKCTYWHCKGTSFAPEVSARYKPPSRSSLGQYPILPASRGRSPARREQEGRRRVEPERRDRDKGHHPWTEEPWRMDREERRSQEELQERRRREERSREERSREERSREEREKDKQNSFLDLASLVRQEVQKADLSLLHPTGAGGSAVGHPRTQVGPPVLNLAELLSQRLTN